MNKKGQFYLLTAIVIITLIIGFAVIYNYANKKDNNRVYDLSNELQIESSKTLDYGAAFGNYPWDQFTKNFSDYIGQEIEIIYIVGKSGILDVYKYDQAGIKELVTYWENGGITTVTVNTINYTFEIKPGENFYFVMFQNVEGEYHVVTN